MWGRHRKQRELARRILGRGKPWSLTGGEEAALHRQPVSGGVHGALVPGGTAAACADSSAAVEAFDLKRRIAWPFLTACVAAGGHGRLPGSLSRLLAAAWYFPSSSTPSQWRPSIFAASRVEPEPANGSSTVSPGREKLSTSGISASMGFCVGWSLLPVYFHSMTSAMGFSGWRGLPLASRCADSCW